MFIELFNRRHKSFLNKTKSEAGQFILQKNEQMWMIFVEKVFRTVWKNDNNYLYKDFTTK